MISHTLAAVALAAAIASAPVPQQPAEKWEDAGEYRITVYCRHCNEPQGHETASGKYLEYGQIAMNNVPFGTKVSIEGEVFTVTDRCKFDDTIDIYMPADKSYCTCDFLDYKEVRIKKKGGT